MYLICPFKFIISKTNTDCTKLGKHLVAQKEYQGYFLFWVEGILQAQCPKAVKSYLIPTALKRE